MYDDSITDENFANATNQLRAGKTYEVVIYPIKKGEWASSEQCLRFLKFQNAILVGAQGLSLLYQLHKDDLPQEDPIVSFDDKEAIWNRKWEGRNSRWVPYLDFNYGNENKLAFDLRSFLNDWFFVHSLVCFRELN